MVFFRETTRKKALELGVRGWVRNLLDGRVEVLVEGDEDKAKKMINWLKTGPVLARVDKTEIIEEKYLGDLKDFEIKY